MGGVVLEAFSGNSRYLGFPIGPDRIVMAIGLLLLVLDPVALPAARLRARPLHLAMAIIVLWAVLSAIDAGTFTDVAGFYGIVDRLGALPFLLFAFAPAIFGTPRRRSVLLAALVGLGLYLGATAVFEGVGATSLIVPRYISDSSLGLHYGRARGPFLEAVADGLALGMCGIAAGMGLALWRSRLVRSACWICLAVCGAGIVFTLTRAVWIGSIIVLITIFASVPRLRRWLLPAAVLGAAATVALLAVVPGLSQRAAGRAGDSRSADDRRNANATALHVLVDRPLIGIGWNAFPSRERDYLRQADHYPVTATGIEVHNVPLSYAAELGLPAALLWTGVFAVAVGAPLLRRAPTREGQVWRAGLLATALLFSVVASLGPLGYALPNVLLWLFAGIAQPERLARRPAPGRPPRAS